MKTIIDSIIVALALLFTILSFSACQQNTIEPVRPTQPASVMAHPDSLPVYQPTASAAQVTSDDDLRNATAQPMGRTVENATQAQAPVVEYSHPTTSAPQPSVQPVKMDTTYVY
ncbi:MAG: hypothetical protein EAZ91_25930 [Cytophagales bacterium]|nr:MAG: hypothetical protein EAZ91_25930 [Cytophagales bacterium]